MESDDPIVSRHAEELSDPSEMWARSYAQFVSTRGPSESLRRSLGALRTRGLTEVYYPRQWDNDDFAAVEVAIDELFRRLGWMKQ